MKKFIIFAGNYGSGKTELSLNTSIALAKKAKTALVDIDVVNPYFRSAESAELLEKNGVYLIAPPYANTNVDVPVLSAEEMCIRDREYTDTKAPASSSSFCSFSSGPSSRTAVVS